MDWQEVMGRVRSVCGNPYQRAVEWKREKDRRVIGWFLYDTPEEIIHASGSLPLAILGSTKHLSYCEAHVQSFVCSLVRSTLELGLDGTLSWLDGIVFPHVCDSAQNIAGVWEKNCSTEYTDSLFWAKTVESPSAMAYTLEEIRRFKAGLETYVGGPIPDETLRQSIRLYNRTRGLLRQISAHSDKLTCREKYDIFKSALLLPKEEFNPLAEQCLALLEDKPPLAGERTPVAISGIMWEPPEILDLFDDLGAVIVADDFFTGSRYFASDVRETGDPIESLAEYQLGKIPFSCYHYERSAQADFLKEQVDRTGAKAMVFLHIKFCDPEDYDYPDLAAAMKEKGVPSIHLDSELQTTSLAQIRTRMEAFLEMVRGE